MTVGKRPRLMMRRTVSVASLGAQAGAGSDAPFDPGYQHVPHQVIGFAPKAFSENSKLMLPEPTNNNMGGMDSPGSSSASSSSSSTPRSGKPFSGLTLLAENKELGSPTSVVPPPVIVPVPVGVPGDKVGLGILAALDKELNSSNHQHHHHHPNGSVSARYVAPVSFSADRKQKGHEPEFQVCIQAESSKYDRCSLRPSFTTLGFLEACYQCKRDIPHGQDIYMYRGDRAFCSAECRHKQILIDERLERREKCLSAAMKQMGGVPTQQTRSHQRSKVSTTPATTAAAA